MSSVNNTPETKPNRIAAIAIGVSVFIVGGTFVGLLGFGGCVPWGIVGLAASGAYYYALGGQANSNAKPDSGLANFVILHHLSSPVEADMVNDIFRQNGIRSVVQSSGMDAFSALSSSAAGAILLVDERDYEKASELYSAYFGQDTSPLTGGDTEAGEDFVDEAE
jgi:hypothetical protein